MKPGVEGQFREHCRHIGRWGGRIATLIGQGSFEEFRGDEATHLAVWKCVEVVGEEAFRILKLDRDFEDRYPQLQLRRAYVLRNQLAQDRVAVDLGVLWTTATTFVPHLVAEANAIAGEAD